MNFSLNELIDCMSILTNERDYFCPVTFDTSKLPCTRQEFEPYECSEAQPDYSFWCAPCKAKRAMNYCNDDNYQRAIEFISSFEKVRNA